MHCSLSSMLLCDSFTEDLRKEFAKWQQCVRYHHTLFNENSPNIAATQFFYSLSYILIALGSSTKKACFTYDLSEKHYQSNKCYILIAFGIITFFKLKSTKSKKMWDFNRTFSRILLIFLIRGTISDFPSETREIWYWPEGGWMHDLSVLSHFWSNELGQYWKVSLTWNGLGCLGHEPSPMWHYMPKGFIYRIFNCCRGVSRDRLLNILYKARLESLNLLLKLLSWNQYNQQWSHIPISDTTNVCPIKHPRLFRTNAL